MIYKNAGINMALSTHKTQILLRILVWMLPIILWVMIGFAIWQYPEEYEFFGETISALGGIQSQLDYPNSNAMLIMIIGFIICSFLTLTISIIYFIRSDLDSHIIKACLSLILTIGALGIAIPHDQEGFWILHGIGAFIFISAFGIFNFIAQVFRFIRRHRPKPIHRTLDWYLDFIMVCLVLLVILLYFLIGGLETFAHIQIPEIPGPLGQKLVLIVGSIATYFLDIDDM
jgi:hypothetical protein